MKESDMEAINVDELMDKIRAEIKRCKGSPGSTEQMAGGSPHVGQEITERVRERPSMEIRLDGYLLEDFLKYHDEDFVQVAYQVVLKRPADPSAFHYFLSNLRSGKMTKTEILGRLRYSSEGRTQHVKIVGLLRNFAVQSSFRIPLLGYILRLVIGIFNLPQVMRNLQVMEGSAFKQLNDQQNRLRAISNALQAQIDVDRSRRDVAESRMNVIHAEMERLRSRLDEHLSELAMHHSAVASIIEQKADMSEVKRLLQEKADTHELVDRLKHKADLWVLESLKEQKADHDALEEVAAQKADREELAALNEKKVGREELVAVSEAKADREALEEVAAQKADREELAELNEKKVGREELAGLSETLSEQIRDIMNQIRDQRLNLIDQGRRLGLILEEARKRLPETISAQQIENMVAEEDHLLNAMYVGFEDKFRGTRQDIKERQKIYLPFLKSAGAGTEKRPVLDVGCGRGEWLELLKENGLKAKGVDANQVMQQTCEELDLDVEMGDALEFLRNQKGSSLGAVTGFQIVEHLSTKEMVALFDESMRALKPAGIVIFETPNPENILVGSCTFYTDPTHNRPIPPDTLFYLLENRGFVKPEIVRSSPMDYASYNGQDSLKHIFHRFNMEMDYAVIASKPS